MTGPFFEELWSEIFDEEWGYAIFDSSGRLIEHHPRLIELIFDPNSLPLEGKIIQDIFPELIGYEKELNKLRGQREEIIRIGQIFRPILRQKIGYVSLHAKAFRDGWLIAIRNTTARSEMEQRIVQQRNELNLLSQELERTRSKTEKLFRTFVPAVVVDDLLKKNTAKLGGERRIVTILFADLRGYTSWAEKHPPEMALLALNALLTSAVEILNENGSTINQLMGDGFMSIFNAPIEQPNHAALALECAKMLACLPGLERTVRFGVGINTGEAMVGNVGSPRMMDYSAIGTTTNIAYRLQQLAGPGEALFTQSTKESAGDQFFHVFHGRFEMKGIREATSVYKLRL
ncbi:MAG: adenylate/guanylate cyclase domain-containing protein [Anaerolineaceae bacterium]|nr:adenylate/guanylate cyclase domain-containing protein [Anaerolineales bacterium]MEB2332912.1 adenylate/guanylate cyclase domain-containing protein [Anaerolineaceae bacterium]